MRSLLLEFRLSDSAVLDGLLHELNLADDVDARPSEHTDRTVVLVAMPDSARLVWSVRSSVSLFDPGAVELQDGHRP